MDGENFPKPVKKGLTNSDKADKIWHKMKEKASKIDGKAVWIMQAIILEGQITEIRYRPSEIEECIRG